MSVLLDPIKRDVLRLVDHRVDEEGVRDVKTRFSCKQVYT